MKKVNIAVLFGGASPEYNVSICSAASVIEQMDKERFFPHCIGISRRGEWFYYTGAPKDIADDGWLRKEYCQPVCINPGAGPHAFMLEGATPRAFPAIDAVLPLLHGQNGEDGTIQGLIALTGLPLIGCGTLCSALCMDKYRAHLLAAAQGIETPRTTLISQKQDELSLFKAAEEIGYPLMVKPLRAGSSFGVTKVSHRRALPEAAKEAFRYDTDAVLEEYIEGTELGCAIIGSRNSQPIVGRIDEIELKGDYFDTHEKYTLKNARIHVPARLSQTKQEQAKELALRLYELFDCTGFARIDLFLTPNGRILFNEINTIPGFTSQSRFPKMLKAAGMSYPEIITKVIKTAVGRL